MRRDQGIVFFPPRQLSPLAAEETHHLEQIVDLRRAQGRIECRHDPSSFGDDPPDLRVALPLDRLPKVRRPNRQLHGHRAIAPAGGTVTIKTALRVKQIHPLIAPATGKPDD